jgi:hypothetical protein
MDLRTCQEVKGLFVEINHFEGLRAIHQTCANPNAVKIYNNLVTETDTTYPTSDQICDNANLFESIFWIGIICSTLIFVGNMAIVCRVVWRNCKSKEYKDIEIMGLALTTMIFSSSLIMCIQGLR